MFDYGLDIHYYKSKPHHEVKHLFSCLGASLVASDNGLPKQMLKAYTFHTLAFLNSSERKTQLLPLGNEVWGKVIFSVACVKNPVHRGSTWAGTPRQVHPRAGTPPWAGTPPSRQVHPPSPQAGTPPGRYTTLQADTPPSPQAGTPPPLGRYTPPWVGTPPWASTPPGQVNPPWAGKSPQAGTPPGVVHAGRYGQQAGGTHPTGMHSCFG